LYRAWPNFLSSEVELCAYQLPGRESRLRDPLFRRISGAVDEAAGVFEPYLEVPFALFGHSMGALFCFELARRLRSRHGVVPVHLFLSARRAPQLSDPRPKLTPLRDEQFVAEISRRYSGIPQGVLQDPEMMELLLPALRADVEMLETYTYAPEAPLECPITAFGGREDTQTSQEELAAWREHTSSQFQTKIFPGDHFFVQSAQTEILSAISLDLKPWLGEVFERQ
jgi:medium-chain acyl-[acyl-carrier-protein] hydrolase